MNLNDLPDPPAPRLRAVRVKPEAVAELLELPDPTLEVYEGGESLGESVLEDLEEPHDFPPYDDSKTIAESLDEAIEQAAESYSKVWAREHTRSRSCPVCPAVVSVLDEGEDLLGIGMSLRAAEELEDEYRRHLNSHTVAEFLAKIESLQQAQAARAVVSYPAADGVVPGPAVRSPERQAAVDALDARLGKAKAPTPPVDTEAHDNALRAARAKRAAQQPTPYDLTPKWSTDQGEGVVGLKR